MKPVLHAAIDAFVDQANPDTNYGNAAQLKIGNDASASKRILIFFAIPFPVGSSVLEAKLYVYLRNAWSGGPHTITAKRVTGTWKERGVTYNTLPASSATNQATVAVTGGADGQEIVLDLTLMLQDVAAGSPWYGVVLTVDTTGVKRLHGAESATDGKKPRLEVTYLVPPQPPTDLRPADGHVVGDSTPILLWTFADRDGDSVQDAFQAQVATNAAMTTGLFDSGTVTQPETEFNTGTAGGFSSLSDGETRYWRVRCRKASGPWSGYSDVVRFTYKSYGTLTLVSPVDPIEETTPPVSHTFTGRTQKATEYALFESGPADNYGDSYGGPYGGEGWRRIWHRTRRATSDLSVTIPPKLIRKLDASSYKIRLDVYDSEDREGLPGAPTYVRVERTFALAESTVPAKPTNLVVTPQDSSVLIAWKRTSQPDFWGIKVDGVYVEDRISGDDPFVSGTDYQWRFYGASPLVSQTYEVVAIVKDAGKWKHSVANPTQTAIFRPVAIYIVEVDTNTVLKLLDRQAPEIKPGVSGAWFYPLNRRDPVYVLDSIRGYEGVAGGLIDGLGQKSIFERFRGNLPDTLYRLIFVDENLLVKLGDFTGPVPRPSTDASVWDVTIQWAQAEDYFRVRS